MRTGFVLLRCGLGWPLREFGFGARRPRWAVRTLLRSASTPGAERCLRRRAWCAVAPDLASCVPTPVVNGSTQDGPNPICGFGPDDDVWYSFVAPGGGSQLVISATGISPADWVMELWNTCPVPPYFYCDVPGGVGFPSDPACEAAVCGADSFCCAVAWDGLCSASADAQGGPGQACEFCQSPAVPPPAAIMCSDDAVGASPRITLCASQYTPGTTYYVRLFTFGEDTGPGTADLCVYQNGAGAAPPNDHCVDEVPGDSPLSIAGLPLVFLGNVTCSDEDNDPPNGFAGISDGWVWESFSLTECADVTISYCGTPSVFLNGSGLLIAESCTGATLLFSSAVDCGDGNFFVTWSTVSPGDYYYQVLWIPGQAEGDYVLTVDAVTPAVPCPTNADCATAIATACDDALTGSTAGTVNNMPDDCIGDGLSLSGQLWYSYTNNTPDDLDVTVSTCAGAAPCNVPQGTPGYPADPVCEAAICGADSFCCAVAWDQICADAAAASPACVGCSVPGAQPPFDTRISVFSGADCNNLCCYAQNDDACNLQSEVTFLAEAGQTYWYAVHGFAFEDGFFNLAVTCTTCAPPANETCATSATLTPVLADGLGVFTTGDNSCAHSDPNPTCDPFAPIQGVWYSFNTGTHDTFSVTLLTNTEDPGYTSTAISYALYDACDAGVCPAGGVTQLACVSGAGGTTALPTLSTGTDYKLLVWNAGGIGLEGTFGILVEFPAENDVMLSDIIYPEGVICGSQFNPQVEVTNNGQEVLDTFTITYDVDGVGPVSEVIDLVPDLSFTESAIVTLNQVTVGTPGLHDFNACVSLPNGVPDQIPGQQLPHERVRPERRGGEPGAAHRRLRRSDLVEDLR